MKKISIFIMALALVLGMMPYTHQSYAASDNTVSFEARVPSDGNIQGDIPDLVIDIRSGNARSGEIIKLTLSDGATWNNFTLSNSSGLAVSRRSGNELEVVLTQNFTSNSQIIIPMDVNLDRASGELSVEIDSNGTAITDSTVRYARVLGREAGITIADRKANVARADNQMATMFTITESTPLAWQEAGNLFELRLPSGFTWSAETKINGTNVGSSAISGRTLMVDMPVTNNVDRIRLEPVINVPRTAELGNLEVQVTRGSIEQTDIHIANIVDYGFGLTINRPVQINLGQTGSTEVQIELSEMIPNTFVPNRVYSLLLEGAEFDETKAINIRRTAGNINLSGNVDNDEITLRPTGTSSTAGRWMISFNIIPDRSYTGDVVLTLESSNGEEGKVIVAEVMQGAKLVIGTPGTVNLGLQQQRVPDITIEESERGGLERGVHTLRIAPSHNGVFIDQATIKTEGNIEIDNFKFENGMFTFEVTNASTRASKIIISDIRMTLTRFTFTGDYSIEHMVGSGRNEVMLGKALFFRAADSAATPGFTGIFRIGNKNFTTVTNGQTRTVEFDTAPYIENSRTMMSVAASGVALGVNVAYDANTRTVTVGSAQSGSVAVMTIGSRTLTVNGQQMQMDTPAVIVNSRTFIPVKYLGNAFGADILWEGTTQTVTINR